MLGLNFILSPFNDSNFIAMLEIYYRLKEAPPYGSGSIRSRSRLGSGPEYSRASATTLSPLVARSISPAAITGARFDLRYRSAA